MKTIEEIRQIAEEKVGHMTSFHKGIWAAGYLTCQADQEKEDLETERELLSRRHHSRNPGINGNNPIQVRRAHGNERPASQATHSGQAPDHPGDCREAGRGFKDPSPLLDQQREGLPRKAWGY